LDEKDKYGNTSLMKAVKNGHIDVARLLIDNGADVNIDVDDGINDHRNALKLAILNEKITLAKKLVYWGADLLKLPRQFHSQLLLLAHGDSLCVLLVKYRLAVHRYE
jgi:serine/threonine-protein phosphatase 6 regulatory ankyrin repeat subunit B